MYDVIIIGAGPTGSTASKILAENGYKVLLVEKLKMPRYKSCSGQLIKKTIDFVQSYFGETVPLSAMCTPTENRGMIFTDDKGKRFVFEQEGLNVWRSSFDNWLAEKAAQYGAEIRDGTAAISCEQCGDSVTVMLKSNGKSHKEQSRYVINCEGVIGALKRKLLGGTAQYITTYQTYNRGNIDLDYHYFHAFLQPELSEYDSWFNVKDEQLVLGVAVKNRNEIERYYQKFISYMTRNFNLIIEQQIKVDKWLMPKICPGCSIDYGVGRILFAGEIAGFLNPMGEGISAGMESGYCAAKSIIKHFYDLDLIYENYKNETRPLHNYMKSQWSFVGRMNDTFSDMKLSSINSD